MVWEKREGAKMERWNPAKGGKSVLVFFAGKRSY